MSGCWCIFTYSGSTICEPPHFKPSPLHGVDLFRLSVGPVLNCRRTVSCPLDYGLFQGDKKLTWHLFVPQLGTTEYKFQLSDFLNVVFGLAALALLKRTGYQVSTPRLLNQKSPEASEFESIKLPTWRWGTLKFQSYKYVSVIWLGGTGELWKLRNVPKKQD
jgi:hypothetical protein